ncbi:AraC family transcriptional regulator [Alteromonas mediterranea]|uniref:AraC family transcriptional regulator n=1 Tax=Alteromonas mediterranea TaxID=314275 RepID=UPI0012F9A107|nr:helix-turn-helix domain-containing protein [Alteromonas mediterranea]QGX61889.1 helix-turn-helix domain-containing protein [Alteromonas mediterranea]
MNLLLVNLNTVVAVLCLLMALHLFFQKTSCQLAIRLLATCFLVLGLHALLLSFNLIYGANALSAALQPTMPALFGPLAYLMFQRTFQTSIPLKPLNLLHLIPANLIFLLMLSEQGKFFADFVILLSLLGYALLLSHSSWRRKSTLQAVSEKAVNANQEFEKTIYLWLLVFTAYCWLVLIGDVLIILEIGAGKPSSQSIALLLTVVFKLLIIGYTTFLALQKSPLFDWVYNSVSRSDKKAVAPEKIKVFQAIINDFERLIKEPPIYTKELISLNTMADRLGVTARLLSNAINHQYGESYTKCMNRLRVNFAAKLLVEEPNRPITSVMFDSGFQTKSSFNKEFKALKELSPSEYREKQMSKLK